MTQDQSPPDGVSLATMMESSDARKLNMAGNAFADRGMWNEAIACYERSRALYKANGDCHGEALVLNNLGATSYAIGDWDEAGRYYRDALAALDGLERPDTDLLSLMNMCFLRYAQGGKPDETLDRAQKLAESLERHDPLTKIFWMRGDAAFAVGETEEAFAFYAQACLHAGIEGGELLERTLSYVDEHARVLRERGQTTTALAFCDHLAQFGQEHSLGSQFATRLQNIRSGAMGPPLLGAG